MVKSGQIEFGEEINVCVPTGNFGNILASYFAKLIGLPICDFICASNKNNVLTDFFNTGVYNISREFYKTNTPSMDILISSNLERLLSLISKDTHVISNLMNSLKNNKEYKISNELYNKLNCFKAYYASEDDTLKTIKEVYNNYNYLIDPHTAVAKACFDKYCNNGKKTLIVSTASPLKFSESILKALNISSNDEEAIYTVSKHCNYQLTNNVLNILNSNKAKLVLTKNEVINYIFSPKFQIKLPATSANLGVGFDVLGLSLNMFNSYRFYKNDTYRAIESNPKHNDPNNNLIIKSYKYVFNKLNKTEIPICLEELKERFQNQEV
jgi:threonine synthase